MAIQPPSDARWRVEWRHGPRPDAVRTRVAGRELSIVNLDKVMYPATGYTKAEVISYYSQIADVLLPYIADRALTRVRFPDGVAGPSFYEKNAPAGTPSWVRTARILTSDGPVAYVVADEPATVVWLANLAALELHVPQWRIGVLDPRTAAGRSVGARRAAGRPGGRRPGPWCGHHHRRGRPGSHDRGRATRLRRSGAGGPDLRQQRDPGVRRGRADPEPTDLGVREAAQRDPAPRLPDFFVASMSIAERAGRIYVDYNQNLAARNTIAPYSLRGRERPSVATPLTWEEVAATGGPDDLRFSPEQVLDRVAEHGDLAADLLHPDRPELPSVEADEA